MTQLETKWKIYIGVDTIYLDSTPSMKFAGSHDEWFLLVHKY